MVWIFLIKHKIRLKSDDGFDKSLPPVPCLPKNVSNILSCIFNIFSRCFLDVWSYRIHQSVFKIKQKSQHIFCKQCVKYLSMIQQTGYGATVSLCASAQQADQYWRERGKTEI